MRVDRVSVLKKLQKATFTFTFYQNMGYRGKKYFWCNKLPEYGIQEQEVFLV